MTTYPFGTYAAGWGTSFSAPYVSGTVAMLASQSAATKTGLLSLLPATTGTEAQMATALTHAQALSDPQMGHGRLDTYQATQAWRKTLGLK
jgi:subtilisin family serine protease